MIEVIRLCEREMEKVLGLRLSSCDRANRDKGSVILNTYFAISCVGVSVSVLINSDRY